jgi:hypothetical protein
MPKSDGKPSLVEFAASLKPKNICRVCELPEVAEINEARKAGVSYENIVRWLVEVRGYEVGFISNHRLASHFKSHV